MKKKLCSKTALSNYSVRKIFLCMKLCFILITASILQVRAEVYSQSKFTLNSRQIALHKLLEWVETKSDYRFLYNYKTFPKDEKVDVNFKEATLPEILDKVL